MNDKRLIRKYTNRRLYDTVASKHVTLANIREMIVTGVDVDVVDDATNDNITRQILLQIINDQEQGNDPLLSEPVLMHLVRFYGNPMQSMMSSYIEKSVETFVRQNATMQEQFNSMLSTSPMANMQEMMVQNMAAWQRMFGVDANSDKNSDTSSDDKKGNKKNSDGE